MRGELAPWTTAALQLEPGQRLISGTPDHVIRQVQAGTRSATFRLIGHVWEQNGIAWAVVQPIRPVGTNIRPLVWGGIGASVLALVGLVIWWAVTAAAGALIMIGVAGGLAAIVLAARTPASGQRTVQVHVSVEDR